MLADAIIYIVLSSIFIFGLVAIALIVELGEKFLGD